MWIAIAAVAAVAAYFLLIRPVRHHNADRKAAQADSKKRGGW
jgi:hypothetical protein